MHSLRIIQITDFNLRKKKEMYNFKLFKILGMFWTNEFILLAECELSLHMLEMMSEVWLTFRFKIFFTEYN